MSIKPYLVQRRMMELGRVRLGEKGPKGEPRKLATLRFTSASRTLLEAIAAQHGGTVRAWEGAPEEGMFEVTTDTAQIDIILPPVFSSVDGSPTAPYSQWFEQWAAGGCVRRCDGETELLSGKPCLCKKLVDARGEDARECKVTTRVSFMLPDIPGLGVWRLESHGYNAAVEIPGTLEVLMLAAAEHKFIPAVLRAEPRTKKVPGEGTRRFIVPVIELPGVTVKQLVSGDVPSVINAPAVRSSEKPALPPAPEPVAAKFENDDLPEFGEPPALPKTSAPLQDPPPEPAAGADAPTDSAERGVRGAGTQSAAAGSLPQREAPPLPPAITAAQKKKLNLLVGQLRESGHLSTENVYNAVAKLREQPVAELVADTGGWDGTELHWAPLRDLLTKAEAIDLIDRLEKLEGHAKAGAAA